jgi:transcriptional regulator with XRE-family HTH domain
LVYGIIMSTEEGVRLIVSNDRFRQMVIGNEPETFAQLLRYYRNRAGLTQLQLVVKLERLAFPVAESTVAMWETGKRLPSESAVFHYLGVSLGLSKDEEWALLQAWLAEHELRALEDYLAIKEESSDEEDF